MKTNACLGPIKKVYDTAGLKANKQKTKTKQKNQRQNKTKTKQKTKAGCLGG